MLYISVTIEVMACAVPCLALSRNFDCKNWAKTQSWLYLEMELGTVNGTGTETVTAIRVWEQEETGYQGGRVVWGGRLQLQNRNSFVWHCRCCWFCFDDFLPDFACVFVCVNNAAELEPFKAKICQYTRRLKGVIYEIIESGWVWATLHSLSLKNINC